MKQNFLFNSATCLLNSTLFGSDSTVVCNEGHEFEEDVSQIQLICLESGEWSEDIESLTCLPIQCPLPVLVPYAFIISGNADK